MNFVDLNLTVKKSYFYFTEIVISNRFIFIKTPNQYDSKSWFFSIFYETSEDFQALTLIRSNKLI